MDSNCRTDNFPLTQNFDLNDQNLPSIVETKYTRGADALAASEYDAAHVAR